MAFETYLLSSFSFDGLSINSKSTAAIDETGSVNTHSADSSRTVNLVTVDGKGVSVSIQTSNQYIASNSKLRCGHSGELVMKGKLRTAGDGLSTEITITIPKAVCTGSSTGLGSDGEGVLTINFEAYDDLADDSTGSSLIAYSL